MGAGIELSLWGRAYLFGLPKTSLKEKPGRGVLFKLDQLPPKKNPNE